MEVDEGTSAGNARIAQERHRGRRGPSSGYRFLKYLAIGSCT
jgi:hypothetical protein